MLFVVQFEDVYADQPERLPERQQHMPSHLAFLAQHPDKVVAAGALRGSQESVKNLGHYAASWIACWPKRPSSTAALT